jgi:hypothetical protein
MGFGIRQDIPRRYDGDSKTDFVARRTVNRQLVWYIYQVSNQQERNLIFGAAGDQ